MLDNNFRMDSTNQENIRSQTIPLRKLDMQRLEKAKTERKIQLQKWEEFESKYNTISSEPKKTKKLHFSDSIVLFDTVLRDDLEGARSVLKRSKVNPNEAKEDGVTPLHQACINNNLDMCKLLLEYGADVNARDCEQWTPLHAAAKNNNLQICKFLLDHNADILAINTDCSIPIDMVEDDDECIRFFQHEFAKRGIQDPAVQLARAEPERRMLKDIERRYHNGDSVDTFDSQGAAPIHVAAACGFSEVARVLFQMGIDPNAKDAEGWTPAHIATFWCQLDILKLLVAHGADFNIATPDGHTVFTLCDSEDTYQYVCDCWNKRTQLRADIRGESDERERKPITRRRSTVHRSSLSTKLDISKREVTQEVELGNTLSKGTRADEQNQSNHPYVIGTASPGNDASSKVFDKPPEKSNDTMDKVIYIRPSDTRPQPDVHDKQKPVQDEHPPPRGMPESPLSPKTTTQRKIPQTTDNRGSARRKKSQPDAQEPEPLSIQTKPTDNLIDSNADDCSEEKESSPCHSMAYSACCRNCTIM